MSKATDPGERLSEDGSEKLLLRYEDDLIEARLHYSAASDEAAIWVGGAGGGLDGPASRLYPRLAATLVRSGVSSLRVNYRRPNHLPLCVADTLIGIAYLESLQKERVVLIGHSFGGAVVIAAGTLSDNVAAVCAMSSQTYGTEDVPSLSPRPLLLLHGEEDEILPDTCSRDIFYRASQPKTLITYPGCFHGLDQCRELVERDLLAWILGVALPRKSDRLDRIR